MPRSTRRLSRRRRLSTTIWSSCWPASGLCVQPETEIANTLLGAGGGAASPAANNIVDLVLGASGYPIPWQIPRIRNRTSQISDQLWNLPNVFGTIIPIATPEGLYPLTGIKDLTFDLSARPGVTILDGLYKVGSLSRAPLR